MRALHDMGGGRGGGAGGNLTSRQREEYCARRGNTGVLVCFQSPQLHPYAHELTAVFNCRIVPLKLTPSLTAHTQSLCSVFSVHDWCPVERSFSLRSCVWSSGLSKQGSITDNTKTLNTDNHHQNINHRQPPQKTKHSSGKDDDRMQ